MGEVSKNQTEYQAVDKRLKQIDGQLLKLQQEKKVEDKLGRKKDSGKMDTKIHELQNEKRDLLKRKEKLAKEIKKK